MDFDFLGMIVGMGDLLMEKVGLKKSEPKYVQQSSQPTKFMFRPETFKDYISQDKAKDKAKLTIELINKGFPTHFLLMGNAGFGKTTLAGIVAKTLGFNFNVYVGSNFTIDTMNDFLIKNADSKLPNVLFIDEAGELQKDVLTYMLPIIEDFKLNGLNLRKFIVICATTDTYMLSKRCKPFLDRISCKIYLEDYKAEDIKCLLKQYNDQIHKLNISEEDYDLLSVNTRYTPRIAISLLNYYVASNGDLNRVLKMNRIIKDGLTDIDIRILKALNNAKGKGVGEEYLSVMGNMTKSEYKELTEPYLCRQGLIARGKSGRMITEAGQQLLNGIE